MWLNTVYFRYFYLCCGNGSCAKLSFCIEGQCRGVVSSSDAHSTVPHALVVLHPCMTALAMLGTTLSPSYHHELSAVQLLCCSNDRRMEPISPANSSHAHQKGFKPGCCKEAGKLLHLCCPVEAACAGTTPQGCMSDWEPVTQSQLQWTLPK